MASEKKTLVTTLRPIIILSKYTGLSVFEEHLITKQNKSCKVVFFNNFINLAAILFLILTFSVGLPYCDEDFETIISALTTHIQRYNNVFLCVFNVILNFINKRKITSVILTLMQIDSILEKYSEDLRSKSIRKRILLIVVVAFFINCAMVVSDSFVYFNNFTLLLCGNTYTVTYISSMVLQCQILIFLNELKYRFRVLNDHIIKTINVYCSHSITNAKNIKLKINLEEELLAYINIHGELCDAGSLINKAFQVQITIKILAAFIYIITSVFYISIELNNFEKNLSEFISYAYFIVIEALDIILLVWGFTSVTREVS